MKSFEDSWKENRYVFESTRNLAKVMYLDGQQSKQAEVDELRFQRDVLSNKVDELQKRIDKAVEHIEDYYGVVGLSIIVDILKGDQS